MWLGILYSPQFRELCNTNTGDTDVISIMFLKDVL